MPASHGRKDVTWLFRRPSDPIHTSVCRKSDVTVVVYWTMGWQSTCAPCVPWLFGTDWCLVCVIIDVIRLGVSCRSAVDWLVWGKCVKCRHWLRQDVVKSCEKLCYLFITVTLICPLAWLSTFYHVCKFS